LLTIDRRSDAPLAGEDFASDSSPAGFFGPG
jgi:hypothetical protein